MRNYLIALAILASSFTPFLSRAAIEYSDGTVEALYHMNGDSVDASGNGHNGTDTGMTYPLSGKFLNAARFTNTYPTNGSSISATVNNLGTWSVNFWINTSSTIGGTGDWGVFSVGHWSGTGDWTTHIDNNSGSKNRMDNQGYNNTTDPNEDSVDIAAGSWKMYTITYDGTNKVIKTYIDGTLDKNITSSPTFNTINFGVEFYIGTWLVGSNYRGMNNGYIDEFVLWNKVLSSTEVTALWNSGYGDTVCTASGCGGGGGGVINSTSTPIALMINKESAVSYLAVLLSMVALGGLFIKV